MTSHLLAPPRTEPATSRPRPLALVATGGGTVAALVPLVVCLCVGVVGWFLSDSGLHGTTRDGLRAGGLAWLMAHGAGVTVQGALVSVVPLGLTLASVWTTWRVAHRVGDLVSGHGPDADRISDGERDWTVPVAVALFLVGYAVVAVVTSSLVSGGGTEPSVGRVLGWTLLLTLAVGAPAIATGSGRAAIWAQFLPAAVRDGAVAVGWVLGALLAVSGLVLLGALLLGLGDAASMMSRLHLHPGEAVLYTLVNVGFLPNAWLMSTSWLLGPGFVVGAGTLVSPVLVVLGPLPLLPLLAALPGTGDPSAVVASVVALPPLAAAVAVALVQRRRPTLRWDEAALRGCGAGIVAGVVVGVLTALAGGAAGPGRMSRVGAPAGEVLVHAITALGIGGLVGALLMTWWQRRRAAVVAVGADRDDIEGLARAERAGVPTFTARVADFTSRDHWDRALADKVGAFEPDLVVLAGFMKLVSEEFLARFLTVNTHPALCPSFPGMHGARDALDYGVKVTGATLFVVDGGVDTGPIVAQAAVPVAEDDTVESLHERIKGAERAMLVDSVGRIAREGVVVDGRKVRFGRTAL